ncbi:cell division protein FtsB [Allocatelliglobosispora scoriae]|uniref:Cell division protein FtsB n=1 Tax=Allocatelliglobosispora scoriae TaxID=643052 RepID=A0A841BNX4_9ACTN|nr:hypothetical protein [Allocatelliglobosispora scoriae]MBB5869375.1 cell division protein FtsB [Allocatelliglobosispora scoriae]
MNTRGNAARSPRDEDNYDTTRARRAELNEAAERRSKLKLAPPAPVSAPRAPFVLLIVFLVVGGTIGILLLNTKINESAFTVGDLKTEQQKLNQRQQQLEQEIADSEAPGNLAAHARKLGLVPAGAPAFIRLPDGRVIGVPQPATGSTAITSETNTNSTTTGGGAG